MIRSRPPRRGARRALRARGLCARRAGDPAAGRAVPRPLGRGHPPPHVPDHRPGRAANCACAPDLTIPVARDYLASPAAGEPRGLLLSRPGVPPSRRRRRRIHPGRHRIVRPRRHRGGRRRDARARARGHRALRHRRAGNPHGRCRAVRRADRRARSCARVEAPAGEGLQPRGQRSRTISTGGQCAPRASGPEYQGVLAALAGSDPKAAHALVTDLLSIAGITAVGGRSVGEIADRFLEQAALGASSGLPRATRALIERFSPSRAIRTRPPARCARSRADAKLDARRRARPVREPHRLPRRARRRRRAHQVLDRASAAASITTRASSSSCTTGGSRRTASWSRAGATTSC